MAATEKPTPTPPADSDWTDLAASLAAAKASRAAQPPDAPPTEATRAAPPPRASFASGLALVLALVAIGVTGMLWWQYRAFYVSLDQTDVVTAQQLDRVRAEQRALQDGLKSAHDDAETLRQRARPSAIGSTSCRAVSPSSSAVSMPCKAARSRRAACCCARRPSTTWASRTPSSRSVGVGRTRSPRSSSRTGGSPSSARRSSLPFARRSRASCSRCVQHASCPISRECCSASAGSRHAPASCRCAPMFPATRAAAAPGAADPEPGFERLWASIKSMLLGLVRIERRDEPVAHALSAAERELGRRELEIEIEVARTAALRAQQQAFRSALGRCDRAAAARLRHRLRRGRGRARAAARDARLRCRSETPRRRRVARKAPRAHREGTLDALSASGPCSRCCSARSSRTSCSTTAATCS